jgi:hypothetical protein
MRLSNVAEGVEEAVADGLEEGAWARQPAAKTNNRQQENRRECDKPTTLSKTLSAIPDRKHEHASASPDYRRNSP